VIIITSLFSNPLVAGWETQWIDRFDGSSLDLNNWTAQTQANYNNEIQCYTDDDSSANKNYDISNGVLKIIARRQAINCPGLGGTQRPWTSGRINSKDKQEFLYGRIESRIRFLDLKGGTWPAFWMLENRIAEQPRKGDNDFVNWPNRGAGEIDVWEWFSNQPASYITNFFNTGGCGRELRYAYPAGAADVQQWHDYAIEWDASAIRFYIDDTLVNSHNISSCAQYKEPMFVLLNVAIGGNLGGAVDPTLSLATMQVDYIAHCSATATNNVNRCNESTPAGAGLVVSDLVIFDDFERTDWAARDCCGTSHALQIDADSVYTETMQFNISGSGLAGFTSRAPESVNGNVFDASSIVASATLEFDLKMTRSPGTTNWKLKLESNNNASAAEVLLSSSIEAHAQPLLEQWQHYSFKLSDLAMMGLDVSAIDLVMIFPEQGTGDGAVYRVDNLKIQGNVSRFAPVITSTPSIAIAINRDYRYTLTATDVDNNTLILSAVSKPTWLDFDANTGVLSGIVTSAQLGDHNVVLRVSDSSNTRTQTFTITVVRSDTPPYLVSQMQSNARVGVPYQYQLQADDADGDPLSMIAISGPGWLSFNPATGLLSGTPNSNYEGENQITFDISDGRNSIQTTLVVNVKSATRSNDDGDIAVNDMTSSDDSDDSDDSGGGGGGSPELLWLLMLGMLAPLRRHLIKGVGL
jgi:beta-glucanase (GH16 family)